MWEAARQAIVPITPEARMGLGGSTDWIMRLGNGVRGRKRESHFLIRI